MEVLRRTRARLLVLGCLGIAAYFVYIAVAGAIRTNQLEGDRTEAELRVLQLQDRAAYLEAVREYVASDAYVEQQARRQLGYVRDGEVPFVVISPPLDEEAEAKGNWIERLFPR